MKQFIKAILACWRRDGGAPWRAARDGKGWWGVSARGMQEKAAGKGGKPVRRQKNKVQEGD